MILTYRSAVYFDEICRRLSSPIEPCPWHSSHQFIRAWAKNLGFDRIDATDCGRAIFKAGYMDSSSLTEETMYNEKWMFESLDERIKYGIETRFLVEFQEVCYAPNIRRLRVDAAEREVSLNWKQLFCLFATVNSRAQVRLRLETEVEPVRTRLEAGAHTEEGSEAGVDREGVDEMGEQDEAVEEGDEEGVQDEASEEEGNEEEDDSGDSYGEEDADWDKGERVLRRKYAPNE